MTRSVETNRLDITPDRLLARLRDLASIGRDPTGGITRPGFSPAAMDANALIADAARRAGLTGRVDAGGNLLLGRESAREDHRVLLLGSHLDTVVNGGRLDGAYGVVAALEVLQTVDERRLDTGGLDVVAVAFANEEGAAFPQPFWGSMVLAGRLADLPKEPADYQGNPLRSALQLTGGDLDLLSAAVWPAERLAGYLELHIEQGPILLTEGKRVGVVDAIVGRTVLQIDLHGVAAHAGTTPMRQRHDPIPAAADLVLFVQQLSADLQQCQVATVGRMEISPNSANTIAGTVGLTVDLRDIHADRLDDAERQVRTHVAELADRHDLRHDCTRLVASRPVVLNTALRLEIAAAADDFGLPHQTLSSGAGHDAQIMATVTPAAMIFVPSIGGVSHVPHEDTCEEDLIAGARVLLRTVQRITDC